MKQLFTKDTKNELWMPFLKVKKGLKKHLDERFDVFTRNTLYLQLNNMSRVRTSNKYLQDHIKFDVTVFEAYKSLHEKVTRNSKYKTMTVLLNNLFCGDSIENSPEKKSPKKMKG